MDEDLLKPKHSETGLMLVEDPLSTLKTMCSLHDEIITWETFKQKYEIEIGRTEDPVDEKTVDTHFYTLTTFDLLLPLETKGQYTVNIPGKDLCMLINDESKNNEFQKKLSAILLGNPIKGKLFKDFLEFVKEPKNKKEIYDKFKNIPGRSLISWSQLAGLIDVQIDQVWKLNRKIDEITFDKFYEIFLETFQEMKKTETFGVSRMFINIDELRKNVCYRLGGMSITMFDNFLTETIDLEKGKIRLYGAPSSVFEERKNFQYKGKLYAYVSIEV